MKKELAEVDRVKCTDVWTAPDGGIQKDQLTFSICGMGIIFGLSISNPVNTVVVEPVRLNESETHPIRMEGDCKP